MQVDSILVTGKV